MSLGLIGRKVGMTRVFTEDGASVPVTVLEVVPNRVTQIKTIASDGYTGLQVAHGERRASRINKALTGHYAKAGVAAGAGIKEFNVTEDVLSGYQVGGNVTVEIFSAGQLVDVTGTSIGKGFAGAIKRHHFSLTAHLTVTQNHITYLALSVWRKIQVEYSLVSACQAI
jgi:large subunit ribosomal protein L3